MRFQMQPCLDEAAAVDQRLAQMIFHAARGRRLALGNFTIRQPLDVIEQENAPARLGQGGDGIMQQALLLLGSQTLGQPRRGAGWLVLRQLAFHQATARGLALMIEHQIAGHREKKGAQIVDALAPRHSCQAQKGLLGQVSRHLAIAGTPGDESLQRLPLFEKQASELCIPGRQECPLRG